MGFADSIPAKPRLASRETELRRALDQIKEKRLLRPCAPNRMEVGVLHHPVTLNQRIDHIAAAQAAVTTQPHGMITFLEIDQVVYHH